MKSEKIRLNKYLAECGICSRREADKYIEQGRVTVNGSRAVTGTQVAKQDRICVDGKKLHGKNKKVVLAYYKPIGVTCTEKDRFAEKTIHDVIHYPVRVTYAGRLDKDSEGLLLLTNDGLLIQKMMKAANCHEKEYVVKVKKELTEEFLKRMSEGVFLKELEQTTRPCKIVKEGKYTFRIVLTQGLNRQIRRMCEALGQEVRSLKRIRVLNIELDDLKCGQYREIKGEQLARLYEQAGWSR
ncbi:MAG: pseudouridine synthase [Clostridiales bacterium]|nr:pseudouridine synthase [Clostridiales bacterium]